MTTYILPPMDELVDNLDIEEERRVYGVTLEDAVISCISMYASMTGVCDNVHFLAEQLYEISNENLGDTPISQEHNLNNHVASIIGAATIAVDDFMQYIESKGDITEIESILNLPDGSIVIGLLQTTIENTIND